MLHLAQYFKNPSLSKERKTQLLKNVDVNYSIPNTFSGNEQLRKYAGYTSLHFAVETEDSDLVNELLKQGANLTKQGTADGYTPLHLALNRDASFCMLGVLPKKPLINILLSKQVEIGNSLNPKENHGLSHLHIASLVSHTEAVELFAKANVDLKQKINSNVNRFPGYTALHCALEYSCVEVVDILIRYGADIHTKNAEGISCLHLLLKRVLDMSDVLKVIRTEKLSISNKKEIERIESNIKLILKARANNSVFVDEIGLSAFHIACTLKDKSYAEDFLQRGINVNIAVKRESKLWPGWTPLHFAACVNIDMVVLLIQNGADIMIKNAKGETALDLCAKYFTPTDIRLIFSMKNEFRSIVLSNNYTRLSDLLLAMDDYKKYSNFLQKLEDVNIVIPSNSPIWPGYNLLHLCVTLNEKIKLWEFHEKRRDSPLSFESFEKTYNCAENEEALYYKRIELCFKEGCSLSMKNANGQTPLHLAFGMFRQTAVKKLLSHSKDNAVDLNGLSHLHIACALGFLDSVKRYLSKGADVNSRTKVSFEWDGEYLIKVNANSTPLHVAVLYGHKKVVEYLLESYAYVYAKDSLGLTPIHLLMSLDPSVFKSLSQLLFAFTPNMRDEMSAAGLSHLHVAAWANDQEVLDELLVGGADVDRVIQEDINQVPYLARFAGKSPLRVALDYESNNAIVALLKDGADLYSNDIEDIFALQNARILRLEKKSIQQLISLLGSIRGNAESSGMSLLHIACEFCDVEWVKKLIEKRVDVNSRIRKGPLQGHTPLHVLMKQAVFMGVGDRDIDLVKLLLANGADVTIECEGSTPLHLLYEKFYADYFFNDINDLVDDPEDSDDNDPEIEMTKSLFDLADLLLKSHKSYNVNPINNQGFSHFHMACIRNDVAIVTKFLNHGVDVNASTDPFADENGGFTPLHFAMAHKSKEVAYLLLERGANVNAEDSKGNKPLHIAGKRKFGDTQLMGAMISRGADVHAKNLSDKTPFY